MSDDTNGTECGQVRELIPEAVIGALSAADVAAKLATVEAHAKACAECRAELELARVLYATRPAVPAGLLERIEQARASERRAPSHTWWGISAAAIAALALGIGITSSPDADFTSELPVAYEAEEGEIWVSDDGLVAGAPALDDLSDEALLQLLDELTTGAGGGSA
jgi:hypothetical protein